MIQKLYLLSVGFGTSDLTGMSLSLTGKATLAPLSISSSDSNLTSIAVRTGVIENS